MTPKRRLVSLLELLAALGLLAFWWFWVVDWAVKPGSYRIASLYTGAVVLAAIFHYRALIRFHRMVRYVRREEALGRASKGSILFAENQRFRYIMRAIESATVLTIGVVAFISVSRPEIALSHWYQRLVITYFVGSILITGYLTVRDLIVLDRVKKINAQTEDDLGLSSVTRRDLSGNS